MKIIRRLIPASALLFLTMTMSACTTVSVAPPAPVTVPEIIQMSKTKVPAEEIIARMRASGTYYHLSAAQLADLRAKGVSDPVINYMQETYMAAVLAAARRQQALHESMLWASHGGWRYGRMHLGFGKSWGHVPRRGHW